MLLVWLCASEATLQGAVHAPGARETPHSREAPQVHGELKPYACHYLVAAPVGRQAISASLYVCEVSPLVTMKGHSWNVFLSHFFCLLMCKVKPCDIHA